MSSYLQPAPFSGPQQVQPQPSNNFSSAIPIKKRRFPIIRPPSPVRKIPCSEDQESETKQEPKTPDEKCPSPIEAKNPSSEIVDKEATPSNIEPVQANVDVLPSKPQEATPTVSLKTVPDSGNKTDVSSKEKSPGPEVSEICTGSQIAIVKQEICGLELSMSLGPKEPLVPVPALEHQESGSDKSDPDPSLLNLALSEKSVCTTVGDVNRSNWDLNTTMDVWGEGSTNSFADIGGFVKTNNLRDEKSSLTTAENVGFSLNKGKRILDVYRPDSPNATVQPALQCKIDDSLGLRLAMPLNLVSISSSRNVGLQQQVHLSPMNVSRLVKSEPVDENCKRDCSIGSSSSTNVGLLKPSTVKTELLHNRGLEIVLHSSVIPDKLVNCKPEDASSSSSCLPVPLMTPQGSFHPRLPSCLELATSGDLSSLLELSLRNKEMHENQSRPCDTGNPSVVHTEKHKLACVDEHTVEAPDDDEKINILAEMNVEESIESDCGSRGKGVGENARGKEDEELEEGEVREPLQSSAINITPTDVVKNTKNLEFVGLDSQNLQRSDLLGDQDLMASDFDEKDYSLKENHEKNNSNKDSSSINEDNVLPKVLETMLEVGFDEKRFVSVTPDRKNIEEASGKEISSDIPTNANGGMIGVELEDAATHNKVVNEICSGEEKVEASLDDHDDAAKDASNKSRIINLARASVVTSPCKTRLIPNRLLTPRSGKERYSDLDGEIHPRGNRDENYAGGSNKFAKDRVHDQRNSRPNFMHGRGRMSGRFGSLRGEWDSDHDFASENSYGQSNYRPVRRKHASSISDVEIDCNGYDIQQDGNNRRKPANDEFSPPLRRTNLRRLSPGDNNRDGPANRGNQTFRRFPRNNNNMSPNRCNGESGSDVMGLRHGDKFMRYLSDDMIDPVYNHPQAMYDELDGPIERGNRNFSNMQRKGYPRIRSKSPGRSRTRSPGLWSSPRRRSPNGLQDLPQHRSPGFYRTGRMRSPDRVCFRDEMVPRRRGASPSYVPRHPNNDLRDVDPGREHVHPRSSGNSNRRTSPARGFPRSGRRTDVLDSREMGNGGDEYMNNGPMQSNKFHELRGDRSMDERRKFIDRRGPGPGRSFRPNYNGEGENFRFHMNDGSRPYRFCPDGDTEFVERGNMREREFDGRIKHQTMVQNRRNRNVEEQQQQDGNDNYRPVERVWHDDGFGDGRVKRRRF
ncbi:hypothetical protein PHJA_000923300 [Phtheirospermum japonicum]|uniref:Uncharacterized protein n=1 Tax=Phtheirospermum japonicum TaxID=374723 RepID=A0A830BLX3_9LAMI|nr:hypothetical protein PHJA_000923300 [Phtheirospermum japonicum]